MVIAATVAVWLYSTPSAPHIRQTAATAPAQVLTWTANDSVTSYASAPTTATSGPATIVFENSTNTGNTMGMPHTLTFDTSTPGYNHDVNINITASPYDANKGRYEVQANLTAGKYRYFCSMPGHQMTGELVVTDGSGTDTTPPQVSASVSGTKDAGGNYVGSATVTISAQDTESGVASVQYALDTQSYAAYTGPLTVNQPGAHTVLYRATDKAGNTSTPGSVQFTVVTPPPADTTPPDVSASVSGTKDAGGNYVGSATVTITATDSGSGVASVEYALDTQPYAAYTGPFTVNQPGAHTVQYRATDKAGNTSTPGSVQFTVVTPPPADTTPPQVSASVSGTKDASGNYVGSATVTITAQDSQSGVASVEYSLDQAAFTAYSGPVSVNLPGNHTLRFRATDKAGNTSPVSSVQFTVVAPPPADTTPPDVSASVSGTKDASGSYVGSATVTITATDSGSGVATVEYSLDQAAFAVFFGPVPVDQPGAHAVRYRATDKAGNTSAVGSVQFTVVSPPGDTTPPQVSASVSGTKDASGNYVGSATVTITAQDSESGVASVEYALDDPQFTTYSAPVSVNLPGNHTLRFRATDKAGNTSPVSSVQFTVVAPPPADTTPPDVSASVSGTKDASGSYVGSATVTITATDSGSGVATVDYSLDGQAYAAYTGPLTVNQPGGHTVRYRATDKAGNTSTVGTASFTVVTPPPPDTTPPQVSASVSGTKDASGNYVGSATVAISAQDTGSGVASVQYALDTQSYAAYTGPLTVNQPGAHTVQYRATDKAGNTSPVGSVQFTVVAPPSGDTTPPQVSAGVTGSQDWAWNYVGSAIVTITATDSGSGVASVEYSLDGQLYAAYTGPLTVNQPGHHTVQYRATDKAGNTSTAGTASFAVVKKSSQCSKEDTKHHCAD